MTDQLHPWQRRFYESDAAPRMQFKGRMPGEIVDEMLKAFEAVKDLPPTPHHFVARHDVPAGRLYRYWDTRGRLIVYVNRAAIESLPKQRYGGAIDIYESPIAPPYVGIPIVMEEVGYQPGQPG